MEIACLSLPPAKNGKTGKNIKPAGQDLPPTGKRLPPILQKPRKQRPARHKNR
jgi:hypothetical protein